jgi:hypothetical protein
MFAKVFGQIFDSSIAEDYNCRRMFIDLLVLADSSGAVDMTLEAIARRTNVPIEEVEKYIKELCQPDRKSRSKLHEGKRLIPLDCARDWGWKIVNYVHYRKIRDEEARRTYFRDAQRDYRKKKADGVKDKGLTKINSNGQVLTPPSPSSSAYALLEELKRNPLHLGIEIDREYEKARQWCQRKGRRLTQRFFENWLKKADRILEAPKPAPKYLPPMREVPEAERLAAQKKVRELSAQLAKELKMP